MIMFSGMIWDDPKNIRPKNLIKVPNLLKLLKYSLISYHNISLVLNGQNPESTWCNSDSDFWSTLHFTTVYCLEMVCGIYRESFWSQILSSTQCFIWLVEKRLSVKGKKRSIPTGALLFGEETKTCRTGLMLGLWSKGNRSCSVGQAGPCNVLPLTGFWMNSQTNRPSQYIEDKRDWGRQGHQTFGPVGQFNVTLIGSKDSCHRPNWKNSWVKLHSRHTCFIKANICK